MTDATLEDVKPLKTQVQVRLDNQKGQLDKHGNFAEVVVRTTPEATDLINFARLWEYVLIQGDRQTRGYLAQGERDDFKATKQDLADCLAFMVLKLQGAAVRHNLNLEGNNFISRVAQRYGVSQKTTSHKED